jgi:hypothetical protein
VAGGDARVVVEIYANGMGLVEVEGAAAGDPARDLLPAVRLAALRVLEPASARP